MKHQTTFAATTSQHIGHREFSPATDETTIGQSRNKEYLPFIIRPVHSPKDFQKALEVRHSAYARHMPLFADALRSPEDDDMEDDVTILLAESKLDGSPLGSARIQNNLRRPLNLEHSVNLPTWLKGKRLAEARRLAVAPGSAGRLVKMALIKACLMYSFENRLQWSVLAARPPLDRSYEKLMFRDLLDGATFIPLPRDNNVPHRVLGLDMETLETTYRDAQHPLLDFFCHTQHPDIQVGQPHAGSNKELAAPAFRVEERSIRLWG